MSIISFDILVEDLEAVLALYDRIQVWRSTDPDGSPVPFTEVTAEGDLPAIADGTVSGPWALSGLSLNISLSNADPISVTFSGTDPLDLYSVLAQVNLAVPGLASQKDNTNRLRLTSTVYGTAASILLTGSAVSVLGFSTDKVNGRSHRPLLTRPTTIYRFRDYDGSLAHWYKTRFYSSKTWAASAFSGLRQGAPQRVISEVETSLATIDLADGAGRPIVGRRIIFVPMGLTRVMQETINYGILPTVDRLTVVTDDRGHAEIALIRGFQFRVFIEGSGYHREITVPDQSTFDVLTELSEADDPFSIYTSPPIPIRLS